MQQFGMIRSRGGREARRNNYNEKNHIGGKLKDMGGKEESKKKRKHLMKTGKRKGEFTYSSGDEKEGKKEGEWRKKTKARNWC